MTLPFSGGQLQGLDVEPTTIRDFTGFSAVAFHVGTATGSDARNAGRPGHRLVPVLRPKQVPSTVSFRIDWRATGPFEQRGSGATVPPEDPAAFLGVIAPARSTAHCSSEEWGFSFSSDRASTDGGYAQIGRSRNGVFL